MYYYSQSEPVWSTRTLQDSPVIPRHGLARFVRICLAWKDGMDENAVIVRHVEIELETPSR